MSFLDFIPIVGPILNAIGAGEEREQQQDNFVAGQNFNAFEAAQNRAFQAGEFATAREYNTAEAEKSRNFNAEQVQAARVFEERMSATAVERARDDMMRSGFNPMLAFMKGQAASTPSVAPGSAGMASTGAPPGATASSPNAPQLRNLLSGSVSSAVEALRLTAEVRKMNADAALAEQQATIRKPVERGSKAIGDFTESAGEAVSSAVMKIEDIVKGAAGNSGGTVDKAAEIARGVAEAVGPILQNPQRLLSESVMSARDVKEAGEKADDRPRGRIVAGSFTGDVKRDRADINKIPHGPGASAANRRQYREAVQSYNLWLRRKK